MVGTVIRTAAVVSVALFCAIGSASAQSGPVGTACKADIAKFCTGKSHNGAVRICLKTNYDKVSAACKKALDGTGGGRGKGLR